MVNPTRGGELARQIQKAVTDNPCPVKIKIQERGGVQTKQDEGMHHEKIV